MMFMYRTPTSTCISVMHLYIKIKHGFCFFFHLNTCNLLISALAQFQCKKKMCHKYLSERQTNDRQTRKTELRIDRWANKGMMD